MRHLIEQLEKFVGEECKDKHPEKKKAEKKKAKKKKEEEPEE